MMNKRNLPQNQNNIRVKRERDPLPWRYCLLTLFCGGILVAGFFLAARLHFGAMNVGIENGDLRKKKDELQSEQRRLKVAREIALSHQEIERAAKSIGMERPDGAGAENAREAEEFKAATPKLEKPSALRSEKYQDKEFEEVNNKALSIKKNSEKKDDAREAFPINKKGEGIEKEKIEKKEDTPIKDEKGSKKESRREIGLKP